MSMINCATRDFASVTQANVSEMSKENLLSYPEAEIEEHQQSLHAGHRGHGFQSLAHLDVFIRSHTRRTKTGVSRISRIRWTGSVITHYRGFSWVASWARTIDLRADTGLRAHLRVACVASAPLSLSWCMRATLYQSIRADDEDLPFLSRYRNNSPRSELIANVRNGRHK